MPQLPSLDSLRCFVEAARFLNFRAAARAVSLTPAALGQRIKQLEGELEVRLFHRTTRSVVLTEAGLRLVPYAQKTITLASECTRLASGELAAAPVDITVGTRHELGMSWLVPMLPALMAAQEGLTIHLYVGSGADLVLRVRTLEIDCAVTSTRLTDPKLDSVRLHEESYSMVGAAKLLRDKPLRRAADAKDHTLLDTEGGMPLFRYWRDAPGGVDSMAFGRVRKMGAIAPIRELALRGEGVAVLPAYFVAKDLAKGALVRVMPKVVPLSDHFRLVFRADDPRRSLYERLAETMRENELR
jgi:LysR family transcriptional regulator, glycine cleavage system transcriptional activator